MQGLPAEYYNWRKLPQSKDRIPMVNFLFSKIFRWDKDFRECCNPLAMSILETIIIAQLQ